MASSLSLPAEPNGVTLLENLNAHATPECEKPTADVVQSVSIMASVIGEQGHVLDAKGIEEAAKDALHFHKASTLGKAFLRIPALLVTLGLELMVAACFTGLIDTFMKYPLLIAFQPVISAISGNVGLQASSANVRALALCIFGPKDFKQGVWPETKAAFAVAVTMGGLTGCVAMAWSSIVSSSAGGTSTAQGAVAFGLAIFCGMLFSVMLAGISGSAAPLLFKMCNFDPSSLAGPLETAIQDIVGGTVLLMLSACILNNLGEKSVECPGGSIEGCMSTCTDVNGRLEHDCVLNTCMHFAAKKICTFAG
jgi:cation transporter-like permease